MKKIDMEAIVKNKKLRKRAKEISDAVTKIECIN